MQEKKEQGSGTPPVPTGGFSSSLLEKVKVSLEESPQVITGICALAKDFNCRSSSEAAITIVPAGRGSGSFVWGVRTLIQWSARQ